MNNSTEKPSKVKLTDPQRTVLIHLKDGDRVVRHWMQSRYSASGSWGRASLSAVSVRKLLKLGYITEGPRQGDWHRLTITDAGRALLAPTAPAAPVAFPSEGTRKRHAEQVRQAQEYHDAGGDPIQDLIDLGKSLQDNGVMIDDAAPAAPVTTGGAGSRTAIVDGSIVAAVKALDAPSFFGAQPVLVDPQPARASGVPVGTDAFRETATLPEWLTVGKITTSFGTTRTVVTVKLESAGHFAVRVYKYQDGKVDIDWVGLDHVLPDDASRFAVALGHAVRIAQSLASADDAPGGAE